MLQIRKLIDPKHLAVILLVSFAAMAPAYFFGVPSGNDQVEHYQMIATFNDAISRGDLFPSFASETNNGFGDMSVRFYPPLLYFTTAAIGQLVGDWYLTSLLVFTLIFFVGAFGIYAWTSTEFGQRQGLIAAVLYTFVPYHLNEMYNNALLAEFAATAILPWCFLFIARLCREPKWKEAVGLALFSSLLLLTHLPLTIIGGCTMALYFLFLLRRTTAVAAIAYAGVAALLSAVLTSFYWTRWLPELSWVAHAAPRYFETTWGFRNNFLLLPSHFIGADEFTLNLWFADLMLVACVLPAIPTIVFLFGKKLDRSRSLGALGATLAISIGMTTLLSLPIWNALSFLQRVQFPWRWLAVVGPFLAVFASVGIAKLLDTNASSKVGLPTVGLALGLAAVAFVDVVVVRGPTYLGRAAINAQLEMVNGASGCDCWWPVWADPAAFVQSERVLAGGRSIQIDHWAAANRSFTVGEGEEVAASLTTFYYPRWRASVNGKDTPVRIGSHGQIEVPLPNAAARVELNFVEPYYVELAATVSALAWLALIALSLGQIVRNLIWNTQSR